MNCTMQTLIYVQRIGPCHRWRRKSQMICAQKNLRNQRRKGAQLFNADFADSIREVNLCSRRNLWRKILPKMAQIMSDDFREIKSLQSLHPPRVRTLANSLIVIELNTYTRLHTVQSVNVLIEFPNFTRKVWINPHLRKSVRITSSQLP